MESSEIYLPPRGLLLLNTETFLAVGSEDVQVVLEDNGLEDDQVVLNAAATLLESFKATHNLEPELPPAA